MKGIYKITCKINNKSYIGKSRNIFDRWQKHIYNGLTCNCNSYANELYKDIKKYGIENFTFEILELAENDKTFHTENDYIMKYDTIKNGYNVMTGSRNFDFNDNAQLCYLAK